MNPYNSKFVQRLDRTAEKNPLLWLPCIILLALVFGIYRLTEDIKTICTPSEKEETDEKSSAPASEKKPFGMRVLSVTLVFLLTAAFMPDFDLNIHAEENSLWKIGYHLNNESDFSIDANEKYDGAYSIKIENTEYNDACVEKTFRVEPNTRYRLSAMVKYNGYSLEPGASLPYSGATMGISGTEYHSDYIMGNVWSELEYVFNTGNRTEITLCLRNGMYGGACKGTAWFSDVRLEKNITASTNEWNVLAVVFKNVNTYAAKDGISYSFVHSLDNADVLYLTSVMHNLYTSMDSISGGRMKVKNIDVAVSDEVLTSVSASDEYAYMLDPYDPQISKVLDQYLENGSYNQIIAISPIRDIAGGWAGLGGSKYKNINFCQINYRSGDEYPGDKAYFPDALFVHEMLHGMETDSKQIDPYKTPDLHDNLSYGFNGDDDECREWYTAYMRAQISGGKGLDPSVYQVYNNFQYVPVSNSMSVESSIGEYEMPFHIHNFSSEWKIDGERHWLECDCGERYNDSTHIMGSGVITVQPMKEYAGVKTYSCTVCGNVIKTETIPVLVVKHKHSFDIGWNFDEESHWYECECGEKGYEVAHTVDEGTIIVQPTEYSAGIITYSCTVCGNVVKTESVPALGRHEHSFKNNLRFDDTSHWYECECGERRKEAAHIAGEGTVTVQPTEESTGVMTYSCTVCGYVVKTEDIPALVVEHRHSFNSEWSFDNASHWHECECGERNSESAHIIGDGAVTVQPTEESTGVMTYSCTVCGYVVKTEVIPALVAVNDTDDTNSSVETEGTDNPYSYAETEESDDTNSSAETERPDDSDSSAETERPDDSDSSTETEESDDTNSSAETERPDDSDSSAETEESDDTNSSAETEIPDDTNNSAETGADDPDSAADTTAVYSDSYIQSTEENVPAADPVDIESFNARADNRITGQTENIQTVRNGSEYIADVGSENQGYYANIYTTEGEFLTDVYISNETAEFTLEEDTGFYIMIDRYPHSGVINNSNNVQDNIDVYNIDDVDPADLSDGEEDIASGAGAYGNSIPMETAAVPASDGVRVPAVRLPQTLRVSNKKRRFSILRREKLDDLIFVY